jgi:hypothetical protein
MCFLNAKTPGASRGAGQKKIDGPPHARAFAKSQTHPPTTRLFFLDIFFKVRFWAFLGEGSSKFKTPQKYFYKTQKVHVGKKIKNFDVRCQFFLDFFVLSRFPVFFNDGSSKTLQKAFHKRNRVEKFFTKNSTKNPKPTFSRFFLSRFWAFLDEGSSKTR